MWYRLGLPATKSSKGGIGSCTYKIDTNLRSCGQVVAGNNVAALGHRLVRQRRRGWELAHALADHGLQVGQAPGLDISYHWPAKHAGFERTDKLGHQGIIDCRVGEHVQDGHPHGHGHRVGASDAAVISPRESVSNEAQFPSVVTAPPRGELHSHLDEKGTGRLSLGGAVFQELGHHVLPRQGAWLGPFVKRILRSSAQGSKLLATECSAGKRKGAMCTARRIQRDGPYELAHSDFVLAGRQGQGKRPALEQLSEDRKRRARGRHREKFLVPPDPAIDIDAIVQEAKRPAEAHVADGLKGEEVCDDGQIQAFSRCCPLWVEILPINETEQPDELAVQSFLL